jgi:hypothetical protein
MSENLIRDLEQAGHPDLAEALKNKELAQRLRASGRDDLADQLAGQSSQPRATPQTEAEYRATQERANQEFVDHLRGKLEEGWTSIPGLLDK